MKIDTINKLIVTLTLQEENLETYAAAVGATPAEITAVQQALANLNFLVDYADLVDENKKTVFQIKQNVYNGVPGEPVAPLPVFAVPAVPFPLISGCLTEALERHRRWKAAPGYTEAIGIALGIAGSTPPPDPGEVKPVIEVSAAQTGGLFSVVVSNRGESDMWDVLLLGKGDVIWEVKKSATGKSTDVVIPPNAANDPQQFQVRVQLKKKNQNYGQPSDIVYVTVNP